MAQRSSRAKWLDVLQSVFVLFCVAFLFCSSLSFYYVSLPVYTSGAILATGLMLVYLVWQGVVHKERLPQTGLELPLLALIAIFIVSLLFSTNPRLGMQRVAQILFSVVLFYVLLGLLQSNKAREKIRWAILWVSGFVIMYALLETYHLYYSWWIEVGSRNIMPPFPFRFNSITKHSNFFMIIVNLCAPLALVSLMKARSRAARFGSMFWLVIYLLATLFSNSRAGWVGAAVWMVTFAALYARDPQNRALLLSKIQKINRKILVPFAVIASIGLFVCLFFLYQFFAGSHPSHGSGTSLNREGIWRAALVLVKSSPWVGTGPGQVTLKIIPASKSSPFGWWPEQAHSTPLQILAEVGVLGFVAFAIFLGMGIYQARNSLKTVQKDEQLWVWASMAAIAGIFVEGFFDDVTSVYLALYLIPFHGAAILYFQKPVRALPQISFAWLAVPLLAAACITGYNIWAYLPFYQAVKQIDKNDWASAVRSFEQSSLRNPSEPAYTNQAGLAWTVVWRDTGDPNALEAARANFQKNLAVDAGQSLVWANLAVLDWQAGDRDDALAHMQKAIELSPGEPLYWLNEAVFLERLGRNEEAMEQYRSFIASNPYVISHSFWKSTPLREKAVLGLTFEEEQIPYWQRAQNDLDEGNISSARLNLASSAIYKETPAVTAAGWIQLVRQEGQPVAERERLVKLPGILETNYWGYNDYPNPLKFILLPFQIAPGFVKVTEDGGQLDALAELVKLQVEDGNCEEAAHTWEVLQREVRAGEWTPEGYPPAPACP